MPPSPRMSKRVPPGMRQSFPMVSSIKATAKVRACAACTHFVPVTRNLRPASFPLPFPSFLLHVFSLAKRYIWSTHSLPFQI